MPVTSLLYSLKRSKRGGTSGMSHIPAMLRPLLAAGERVVDRVLGAEALGQDAMNGVG